MLNFPNNPTQGQVFQNWTFDSVKWVPLTATALPFTDAGRNLLHNSLFAVAQRGTGPWTTAGYTVDRWTLNFGGSDTASVSRIALADADRAAIGDEAAQFALQTVFTTSSAAGSFNALVHKMESVTRLSNKVATVSLWVKANTGTPRISCVMQQVFGTGGSPSANVNLPTQTITLSTSWARYSLTFNFPSVAGKTFGTTAGTDYTAMWIQMSNQSDPALGVQPSNTVQLWGCQLEYGSVSTPLMKRDPADDLAVCQRFYALGSGAIGGYGGAGLTAYGCTNYAVTMRAAPTVAVTPGGATNCSGTTGGTYGANTIWFSTIATAAGGFSTNLTWTASADL